MLMIFNGSSTYAPTTVNITSTGTADMSTYGTVRARLGWALGNFLPYLVAGISFAQIDSSRFVDVSYFGIDITPQSGNPPSPPQDRKSTRLNSSHRSLSRMPSSA